MTSPTCRVQGFLAAGHVCSVMGTSEYPPLAERLKVPIVVTGFEPLDILEGIRRTVRQLERGEHYVDNAYGRAVPEQGNPAARALLEDVFEVTDRGWRGIGIIGKSGWRLSPKYREFDAEYRFEVTDIDTQESTVCRSGEVLQGLIKPHECAAFGKECTPRNPLAPRWCPPREPVRRTSSTGGCRSLSRRRRLRVSETANGAALDFEGWTCPLPLRDSPHIVMGHGGGGQMSAELIEHLFVPAFGAHPDAGQTDSAVVKLGGVRLAFSTDTFVVRPLFFPGGSIGHLAANGTLNDLALSGAVPSHLSCGFVLEEGTELAVIGRVAEDMGTAARAAGVNIVTGDTKVVDAGHGDQVYVNTAGIGLVPDGVDIRPDRAEVGDVILVSGPIGVHGIAIMSVREGLEFGTQMITDSAALHPLVAEMIKICPDLHVLRDPTRGGLGTSLNEIARSASVGVQLAERSIPVPPDVAGACTMLGLDPLYVANEGKLVAFVPRTDAEAVLAAVRAHPLGRDAAIIGECVPEHPGMVVAKTAFGGTRVVDTPLGEQLPRIC
jgi:hydrogenase expression/formation protein HypE